MIEKYKLVFEEKGTTLDPHSYQPIRNLEIKLGIIYEAQQDGRPLPKEKIEELTKLLIQKINLEIGEEVKNFIQEVNPYG